MNKKQMVHRRVTSKSITTRRLGTWPRRRSAACTIPAIRAHDKLKNAERLGELGGLIVADILDIESRHDAAWYTSEEGMHPSMARIVLMTLNRRLKASRRAPFEGALSLEVDLPRRRPARSGGRAQSPRATCARLYHGRCGLQPQSQHECLCGSVGCPDPSARAPQVHHHPTPSRYPRTEPNAVEGGTERGARPIVVVRP